MNRIYRIVWNATINRWVVASEVAKGRKKKTGRGEQAATGAAVMFAATLMVGGGVPLSAQAQSIQGWSVAECYLFPSLYPRLCGGNKGGSPAPAPAPSPAPDAPRLPDGAVNTFKYFKANSSAADASATGSDSIAVGPRAKASGTSSSSIGDQSIATHKFSNALGAYAKAEAEKAQAFGHGARANGLRATSVGPDSVAGAEDSISIGSSTSAKGDESIAIGDVAKAEAQSGISIGAHSMSSKSYGNAVGAYATAEAEKAQAFGHGSRALGARATAVGPDVTASGVDSVSIGSESNASHVNAVALGSGARTDRADSVSVGNATRQRQITRVAAGTQGTDAVNVSQLQGVTGALGGGAAIDGNGGITAPSYTINGDTYRNVGDALAAAAASGGASKYFKANSIGTDANASGANAVAAGQNARAQADRSVALGVDAVADRADSVSVGNATGQRQVIHMAAGTEDTDAVNVSQLKASGLIDAAGKAQRAVLFDGPNGEADVKGRRIINVADAVADTDALTLAQLKGAGLTFNGAGQATSRVVAYQPLSGVRGNQPLVVLEDNTLLRNVAAGQVDTDAANVGQVHDIVRQSTSVQTRGTEPLGTLARAALTQGAGLERAESGQAGLSPITPRSGALLQPAAIDIGEATSGETLLVAEDRASLPTTGSGVKVDSSANLVQFYANDYLRASGRADSAGSAPASDAAVASVPAAVAIGANSRAFVEGSTALGAQSVVTSAARDSVALGAGSVATEANVVSVGNDGTTAFETFDRDNNRVTIQNPANSRRIVNMAAGHNDNDAVNVAQLKGVTTALGGGAGVAPDGTVTAPSYEVGGNKYGNVGDALKAAADAGAAGSALAVKYADAGKGSVALEGAGGTTISNLKAGVGDTDAVNVSQLKNSGLIDADGKAQKAVLFNGPNGEANAASQKLVNLAAGAADTDGVNLKQLKDAGVAVDDKGNVTNAFVAYDAADKAKVTLGGKDGTTLANVKAGTADLDAVNVKQFKDAGLVDENGKAQKAVLFNGPNGEANAAGTKVVGVAQGVASTDAVNIGQLKGVTSALGGGTGIDDQGNVTAPSYEVGGTKYGNVGDALKAAADSGAAGSALAVKYADAGKTSIALEGAGGTTISNLKAGVGDTDAVNVSQLKSSGLIDADGKAQKAVLFNGPNGEANAASQKLVNLAAGAADTDGVNLKQLKDAGVAVDDKGNVTNAFVAYDAADKAKVTLGGKDGTTLANVKAGTADLDAVNVKQFKDAGLVDENGKAQKAVLFNGPNGEANAAGTKVVGVAQGVASTDAVNIGQLKGVTSALGGGTGIDDQGNVTAPSYEVGGTKYGNVGDALKAAADTGAAASALAVKYADADKTSIALEGKGGTTIGNVKAAAADDQAVNLKQLKDAGATVDDTGNITNAFVAYDAADKAKVTLGGKDGTTLANVKAGTADLDAVNVKQFKDAGLVDENGKAQKAVLFNGPNGEANAASQKLVNLAAGAADTDGVNLKQLKDAGVAVDDKGNVTNAFVAYDAADKAKVTLGGVGGTTLANVKAGAADLDAVNVKQFKDAGLVDENGKAQKAVLFNGPNGEANAAGTRVVNVNAGIDDTDALNVKQLKDAGITIDPTTGAVTNAFVAYDAADKAKVTLGGKDGTTLANLKAATADDQAVNLAQLKSAGIAVDDTGKVTNAFVTYDDAAKGVVTLGGGTDGTAIRNLKAGIANTDATNVSQLRGLTTALGGAASVGTDGAIVAPTYTLAGNTYHTVSDALDDLDGRTVANTQAIADLGAGKGIKYFRANSSADDASATGENATAMGPLTQATGKVSVAAGASARALDEAASAFGTNAEASKANSTAVGASAKAAEVKSIAIGNSAMANAEEAVAMGASAAAAGKSAVALGSGSEANGESSVALGHNAHAAQANAVALGSGSVAERANTVSVGNATQLRQITSVGAGTSDTDAVNVSQLKASGLVDENGKAQKAVLFNGPNGEANAADQKLVNLAAGAADTDGVNLKQLKDAGVAVDDKGNVTNAFVAYDAADKAKVTLGGKDGTTLANVKAGTADLDAVNVKQFKDAGLVDENGKAQKAVLFNGPNGEANAASQKLVNLAAGAADTDGVNLKQLKDAGVAVDDKGNVTNAFVAYDAADKAKVTLGGKDGTTLANVKAGTADLDAVNVKQFKDAGLVDDNGKAQKAVLFNGPNGEANAAGTKVVGVAQGVASTDAVNIGQLKGVTSALGGGAGVDDQGNVTAPSYEVGGTKYGNVGDALKAAADSGAAGSALAVKYADAGKTSIALEGAGGTTISNLKAGVGDTDAVNVSQLKNSGLIDADGKAQKAVLFNGPNGEANAAGQKLVNVAAGADATDAVNISQLAQSGLFDLKTGTVLRGITYVAGSVEAGLPRIELDKGTGNSRFFVDGDRSKGFLPKGTVISNVAEAIQDTDAANLGQVKEISDAAGNFGNVAGSSLRTPAGAPQIVLFPEEERVSPLGIATTRAASQGSGTKYDDTNADRVEFYANNYLRATGRGDGAGSTPPSDTAVASYAGSISIGADSQALTAKTTAVGAQAIVTEAATDSVALGTGSVANQANVISVGNDGTVAFQSFDKDSKRITIQNPANTRRIVNMAAGQTDNDAVNVSQLKQVTSALGGGAAVAADGSVNQPTYHVGGGSYATVDEALKAVDARAGTGSALGITYDDDSHGKVTFGGAGGTTLSNVKAGTADTDAVNVSQLKASGLVDAEGNAVAAVTYDDAGKTAITLGGKGSTTPVRLKNVAAAEADDEAVNLKQLKTAGLVGGNGGTLEAVVYDEGSSRGAVTFGGAAGTVLNNVADGNIAAGSRQAVNGGQIATLRDALQGQINGLDGRVTKTEEGLKNAAGNVPYVSVKGPGADASSGADGSGSVAVGGDSKALGERSVAVGNGAQVQAEAPNAVALGSNSIADRAGTVSVGAPGSERAIANVANGTADTDAVNVRQMNQGVQSAKDYTDSKVADVWNTINRDVDQMNRQVNRGIAAASALVNVTPYLPGRTAVNAGVASYRGEAALGVGLSRWSDNGRFNFNAGVSAAKDDEPVYRVGVGYVF